MMLCSDIAFDDLPDTFGVECVSLCSQTHNSPHARVVLVIGLVTCLVIVEIDFGHKAPTRNQQSLVALQA